MDFDRLDGDSAAQGPGDPSALPSEIVEQPDANSKAENIAVGIRVRPLNDREVRAKDVAVVRALPNLNAVSLLDRDGKALQGKQHVFRYDHIFDHHVTTREMYETAAKRIVTSTLHGINGTIFAYGQTSSGKTFTMQGSESLRGGAHGHGNTSSSSSDLHGDNQSGILQLAVEEIFNYIEQSSDRDFLLRVSYVEIYNEIVRDLLGNSEKSSNLKLREDPRKGVYVECEEPIITDYENIWQLLRLGEQRRTVGQTAMNERSSRSHSIFRIVIESKQKNLDERRGSEDDMRGAVLVGCLSLVDLAGSESLRHTMAEGIRQREAGNINKSLLTLSRVINSLSSDGTNGNTQNAPFRDSKLTRLLQNSLDGNTRTLIICCVTPSDRHLDETRSTLQFAARAKRIQTSASVNEVLDDQAQLKRLKREVHELKKLVHGNEMLNALKAENEQLVRERNLKQEKIERLQGLVLSGSKNGFSSCSAVKKPRAKRCRETWAPGELMESIRSRNSREQFTFLSPNPRLARKPRMDAKPPLPIPESDNDDNSPNRKLLSAFDEDSGNEEGSSSDIDMNEPQVGSDSREQLDLHYQPQEQQQHDEFLQELSSLLGFLDEESAGDPVLPTADALFNEIRALVDVKQELNEHIQTEMELRAQLEEMQSKANLAENMSDESSDPVKSENESLRLEVETLTEKLQRLEMNLAAKEADLVEHGTCTREDEDITDQRGETPGGQVDVSEMELLRKEMEEEREHSTKLSQDHERVLKELEFHQDQVGMLNKVIEQMAGQLENAFVEAEEAKLLFTRARDQKETLANQICEQSQMAAEELRAVRYQQAVERVNLSEHTAACSQVEQLTTQLVECEAKLNSMTLQLEQIQAEREQLRQQVEILDRTLGTTRESHQEQAAKMQAQHEQDKQELIIKLEQVSSETSALQTSLTAEKDQLQQERNAFAEDLAVLEAQMVQLTQEKQETESLNENLESKCKELTQVATTLKSELEQVKQRASQTQQSNRTDSNSSVGDPKEWERMRLDLQSYEDTVERLREELKQSGAACQQLEGDRNKVLHELKAKVTTTNQLEDALERQQVNAKHLVEECQELRYQKQQLLIKAEQTQTELADKCQRLEKELVDVQQRFDQERDVLQDQTSKLQTHVQRLTGECAQRKDENAFLLETQQQLLQERKLLQENGCATCQSRQQHADSPVQDASLELQEQVTGLKQLLGDKEEALRTLQSKLDEAGHAANEALRAREEELVGQMNELKQVVSEREETIASLLADLQTAEQANGEIMKEKENELRDLQQQLSELQELFAEKQDAMNSLSTKLETDENENAALTKEPSSDEQNTESQETQQQDEDRAGEKDSAFASLTLRLSEKEQLVEESVVERAQMLQQLTELDKVIHEQEQTIQSLTSQLEQVGPLKDAEAKNHQEMSGLQQGLSDLQQLLNENEEKTLAMASEMEKSRGEWANALSEKKILEEEVNKMRGEVSRLNDLLQSHREQMDQATTQAKDVQSDQEHGLQKLQQAVEMRDEIIRTLEKQLGDVQQALTQKEASLTDLESRLKDNESDVEQLARENKQKQSELQQQLEQLQQVLDEKEEAIRSLVEKVKVAEESTQEALLGKDQLQKQLKDARQRLDDKEATIESLLSKLSNENVEHKELFDSLQSQKQQLEHAAQLLQDRLSKKEAMCEELRQTLGGESEKWQQQMDSVMKEAADQLQQEKTQGERFSQECDRRQQELNSMKAYATKQKETIETLMEQLRSLTEENKNLQSDSELGISKLQQVVDKQLGQIQAMQTEWNQRQTKWEETELALEKTRAECRETQRELEQCQLLAEKEIQRLSTSMANLEVAKSKLSEQLEEKSDEAKLLQDELNVLQQLCDQLKSKEAAARKESLEKDAVVMDKANQLEQLRCELERLQHSVKELTEQNEKLEGESYLHRNEQEELTECVKSAQMEAEHYRNELETWHKSKQELELKLQDQSRRIEELEAKKMTKEMFKTLGTLGSEMEKRKQQVKTLQQENAKYLATIDQLKQQQVVWNKSLKEAKAKVEEAQEIKEQRDRLTEQLRSEMQRGQELEQQLVVLRNQMDQQSHDADSKNDKVGFLVKENLDLHVEIRNLEKQLAKAKATIAMASSGSAKKPELDHVRQQQQQQQLQQRRQEELEEESSVVKSTRHPLGVLERALSCDANTSSNSRPPAKSPEKSPLGSHNNTSNTSTGGILLGKMKENTPQQAAETEAAAAAEEEEEEGVPKCHQQ